MIKFKKLSLRNFLSVGAITEVVNFEHDDITLILGQNLDIGDSGSRNGVGKSTCLAALCYVIYDKTTSGISKDNLINKVNKRDMCVSLELEIDGVPHRIVRGRKKNILELFVDNKEYDPTKNLAQGEMKDTQYVIEHLIGLSFNMFTNIIALDTNATPFLSMRAKERNEVIEELLGITQLSEKAATLKELSKDTKYEIQSEEMRIKSQEDNNKRIQSTINDLQNKSKKFENDKMNEMVQVAGAISKMSNVDITTELENHQKLTEFDKLGTEISLKSPEVQSLDRKHKRLLKEQTKLQQDLIALEANKCPTCQQGFKTDDHVRHLQDMASEYAVVEQEITDTVTILGRLAEEIGNLMEAQAVLGDRPVVFYNNITDAYDHKNKLEQLEYKVKDIDARSNPYIEQIESLEQTALQEVDYDELNRLVSQQNHQTFLLKLLTNKDSFVRKQIINQNLMYLNKRLSNYLQKMGLPHRVEFLNDLSVEIVNMGEKFDFGNLSRGEQQRLILSLSWAFRDVWESTNNQFNLLFIDELLDSGLDSVAVESAIGILKHMNHANGKDLFIISHRDDLIARVNNVLMAVKENGFTSYRTSEDT